MPFKHIEIRNLGWFSIISKHSGLALDIEEGKHGGNIITYQKHGGDNQLWSWRGKSILSKLGYVLEVKDGESEAGTNVIAGKHHGGPNQHWKMKGHKITSKLNDMALDIEGGSTDSNINIIVWPLQSDTDIDNQSWELEYV